jgi:hypothetical protein
MPELRVRHVGVLFRAENDFFVMLCERFHSLMRGDVKLVDAVGN